MAEYKLKRYANAFQWKGVLENEKKEPVVPSWFMKEYEKGEMMFSVDNKGLLTYIDGRYTNIKVNDYIVLREDGTIFSCSPEIFESLIQ